MATAGKKGSGPFLVTMMGTFPPVKGISRTYCVPLARALSRRIAVDVVSFSHIYPERLYPGGTRETGPEVRIDDPARLRVRAPLAWFNPLGWIRTALRFPGQLLHVHWWTYFLAPVAITLMLGAKLRRRPVVMTVHNVLAHETHALDRLLAQLAFALPDAFIVHTDENRRQLAESFGIALRRIEVVPFGALTDYDDAPVTREDARRELGLAAGGRVVLFFGHIRDYKGLDVLLRAFRRVADEIPDARLVVAGTCWTGRARYEALIDTLGIRARVQLDIGYVPTEKVKVYFRAADLVALPYRHFEAQSGPGNIALAFGAAVVVTRTGGLPDLVRDGRAVVAPDDDTALARVIADCLGDPGRLARMADDSRALAKEFSWDAIAEKTVALYQRLLSRKKPAHD